MTLQQTVFHLYDEQLFVIPRILFEIARNLVETLSKKGLHQE